MALLVALSSFYHIILLADYAPNTNTRCGTFILIRTFLLFEGSDAEARDQTAEASSAATARFRLGSVPLGAIPLEQESIGYQGRHEAPDPYVVPYLLSVLFFFVRYWPLRS